MSEAPERIKVWPDVNDHFNPARPDWSGGYWDDTDDPSGTEYIRADLVQAAVAAALTEAAECCTAELRNTAMLLSNPPQSSAAWGARNAILALITPDAQAALDRVVAQRVEEMKGQNNE